ncbi:MAG: TadE family protein [bacterium]
MKVLKRSCSINPEKEQLNRRHGQALVETAVLLTVIMILLYGVILIGRWGTKNFKAIIEARNNCRPSLFKSLGINDYFDLIGDIGNIFSKKKSGNYQDISSKTPAGMYLNKDRNLKREAKQFLTRGVIVEIRDGSLKGRANAEEQSQYLKTGGKPLKISKTHNFFMESDDWSYRLGSLSPSTMNSVVRLYLMSELAGNSQNKIGKDGKNKEIFDYKTFSFWRSMELYNTFLGTGAKLLAGGNSSSLPEELKKNIPEKTGGQ